MLAGLQNLKNEYGGNPYNTYRADDRLYFPVKPEWSVPRVPKKTPMVGRSRPTA